MAHANVALNFNAFLKKTKLNDDGSNYTDWVRNLRIILIAAKKAYVLDAPLGEAPVFPATQDVMNAWQSHSDDYSLVLKWARTRRRSSLRGCRLCSLSFRT